MLFVKCSNELSPPFFCEKQTKKLPGVYYYTIYGVFMLQKKFEALIYRLIAEVYIKNTKRRGGVGGVLICCLP